MMNGWLRKVAISGTLALMLLTVGGQEWLRAQGGLDLKALVNTRTDELIKLAQDLKLDISTLTEFKKSFNADQVEAASKSLNAFPVIVVLFADLGRLKKLDEATLQASLYKLMSALELFLETVKKQEAKICVALYLTEKKGERIVSPFINEAPKEIGGTVPLKLQEQRCI